MTSVSESLVYEEIMEDIANIASNSNKEDLYNYMSSLIERANS